MLCSSFFEIKHVARKVIFVWPLDMMMEYIAELGTIHIAAWHGVTDIP